jgi:hypothetical protein
MLTLAQFIKTNVNHPIYICNIIKTNVNYPNYIFKLISNVTYIVRMIDINFDKMGKCYIYS